MYERLIRWLWLLGAVTALASCAPAGTPTPAGDLTPTPAATARPPILTSAPTPAGTETPAPLSLVVWMNDEFALAPAAEGGQLLATQVAAFNAAFSNTRVSVLPKKPYGKGGVHDLLVTTYAALPQALPDLATVDLRELPRLAREGMLQAYDGQFAPTLLADLYSFARQAGQVEGRTLAVPFTADVLHLVYDGTQVQAPPLTWSGVISGSAKYALAAGGEDGLVNDSLLVQYVALGGQFADARGRTALDRTALRDALEYYRGGIAQGVIMPGSLNLKTAGDAWRTYRAGKALMVDAPARDFLRDRAQVPNAGFAAIPTRDGKVATLARCWGYVLTAKDPARRAVAQRFVEWLLAADNNAAWNRAAYRLPVRRSALAGWSNDTSYRDFIHQLLVVATNRPAAAAGDALDIALQTALVDVLVNNLSPADAADKAAASLAR